MKYIHFHKNQIHQYSKRAIHYDQVMFVLGIQGDLTLEKSTAVIHHMKFLQKIHPIISFID